MMFIEIACRLIEMVRLDQELRTGVPEVLSDEQSVKWKAVDSANSAELKHIILRIGWPTASKVGEEASEGAWLLVQHADHDVAFQKYCLHLMTAADVPGRQIAYLYDRICVNEGQPQYFGTQFITNDYGAYGPQPIELPELVDERRQALGLEPLAEYKKDLQEKYGIRV